MGRTALHDSDADIEPLPTGQAAIDALAEPTRVVEPASNPRTWHKAELYVKYLQAFPSRNAFLCQLQEFMNKRGTPIPRHPILSRQIIDLYTLFEESVKRGGFEQVVLDKVWKPVSEPFGLPKTCTSRSYSLKNMYESYLFPFERVHILGLPDDIDRVQPSSRVAFDDSTPLRRSTRSSDVHASSSSSSHAQDSSLLESSYYYSASNPSMPLVPRRVLPDTQVDLDVPGVLRNIQPSFQVFTSNSVQSLYKPPGSNVHVPPYFGLAPAFLKTESKFYRRLSCALESRIPSEVQWALESICGLTVGPGLSFLTVSVTPSAIATDSESGLHLYPSIPPDVASLQGFSIDRVARTAIPFRPEVVPKLSECLTDLLHSLHFSPRLPSSLSSTVPEQPEIIVEAEAEAESDHEQDVMEIDSQQKVEVDAPEAEKRISFAVTVLEGSSSSSPSSAAAPLHVDIKPMEANPEVQSLIQTYKKAQSLATIRQKQKQMQIEKEESDRKRKKGRDLSKYVGLMNVLSANEKDPERIIDMALAVIRNLVLSDPKETPYTATARVGRGSWPVGPAALASTAPSSSTPSAGAAPAPARLASIHTPSVAAAGAPGAQQSTRKCAARAFASYPRLVQSLVRGLELYGPFCRSLSQSYTSFLATPSPSVLSPLPSSSSSSSFAASSSSSFSASLSEVSEAQLQAENFELRKDRLHAILDALSQMARFMDLSAITAELSPFQQHEEKAEKQKKKNSSSNKRQKTGKVEESSQEQEQEASASSPAVSAESPAVEEEMQEDEEDVAEGEEGAEEEVPPTPLLDVLPPAGAGSSLAAAVANASESAGKQSMDPRSRALLLATSDSASFFVTLAKLEGFGRDIRHTFISYFLQQLELCVEQREDIAVRGLAMRTLKGLLRVPANEELILPLISDSFLSIITSCLDVTNAEATAIPFAGDMFAESLIDIRVEATGLLTRLARYTSEDGMSLRQRIGTPHVLFRLIGMIRVRVDWEGEKKSVVPPQDSKIIRKCCLALTTLAKEPMIATCLRSYECDLFSIALSFQTQESALGSYVWEVVTDLVNYDREEEKA